jgi:hypothetical protein
MINNSGIFLVFLWLTLLLCVGKETSATENVAAVRSEAIDNWVLDTVTVSPYYPPTTNLRPVGVYTVGEIDMVVQGLNQRLDSVQNANTLIEQKVQAAEIRIRGEVKNSLEVLPQRLLATEEMKDFKESLLAELHRELAQLRQDVQKQIDKLKTPRKP